MGWASSVLLPVEGPATASPPPAPRFKGPEEAALESLGLAHAPATSLEPRQAEIAVLATAYAYRSAAAWTVHVREAREAGLEDEHIAAIARGMAPAFPPGSTERAVYAIASDLLEHKRVSAANYAAGVDSLGEKGVVELVKVVGYYGSVALTLNAFEIDDPHTPDGVSAKSPWEADAALVG